MANDRPDQTAADYVTIVLSPALVMGLVGSLVFFLLEVFYRTDGPWKLRLQWILFFYVFGAVLAARISMMGDIAPRAGLYSAVLALLTYIGLQSFVEYPEGVKELSFLINLFLIGVVWWCARRITWDCTNVDEQTDMSGEGLLQAAGFEERPPEQEAEEKEEQLSGLAGWWQRYQRYWERRQKKRTLGVWVVYFSLAALPIFGMGQSLIPLTAPDRRQFAFWLMTVYVACGLGLLLTTCFLGLRRYLRQRRLQMPAAMTGAWLTMGGSLLLALLVLGAFMPRPYAEYSLLKLVNRGDSKKRDASRFAVKGDSPGEGQGQPGEGNPDGKQPGRQPGEKGKGQGGEPGGNKSGQGEGKGDKKSGGSGDKSSRESQTSASGDQKGEKADSRGRTDRADQQRNKGRAEQPQDRGRGDQPQDRQQGDKQDQQQPDRQGGSTSRPPSAPRLARVQEMLQRIAPVLKWIVFAVLAIVVVIVFLRAGLGFLANFTDWAKRLLEAWRNFWAKLFGGVRTETAYAGAEVAQAEEEEPPVPFSAFANPFDTGEADTLPPRELVRYTFRAVEAWAREHDLGRRDDETAQEFLARLGEEIPALAADGERLAGLHARAEYARGGMPGATAAVVQAFWQKLERVGAAPLSA